LADIHLPTTPVLVEPNSPKAPKAISEIARGTLYVVESTTPLIQLQAPEGFLNVVSAKGPLSVFGIFADGSDEPELRKYASENLMIVTGIKPGRTELILIPVGVTEQESIVRQILTVTGEGPRPPPVPVPPTPEPQPDPAPQPVVSFRVIFVKESGSTLSAEQSAIPGAKSIRDYLTSKTTPEGGLAGWREYDPQQNTTNEQATMKALWAAVKPNITNTPVLVVEVNGKATVREYPKNTADALKILKEYGGQ